MRVVDGDTIEVATDEGPLTVRLAAINAPEGDECWGDEARSALESSLGPNPFTLVVVGDDPFGRALGRVRVGGSDVNLRLVAEGAAIASGAQPPDAYTRAIVAAEEEAYRSGLGLWSPSACGDDTTPPQLSFDIDSSIVDPPGPDDEDLGAETMVVVNEGDAMVALAGWVLRDESSRHRYVFPSEASLDAGDARVVASSDPGWDPGGSPVWNNDGDMALLLTPHGTVVARWRY